MLPVGLDRQPFVVAEMSGNHNQSLDTALKIVNAAAVSGVDALKLQTYDPNTLTLDLSVDEFFIDDKDSLWFVKSFHELYREAQTPWDWHEPIMNRAKELGLLCFSSPFDEAAVDFLEELDVPAYKIASFENVHLPLIKKAAATGKPIIISVGMATISEIDEAVKTAREAGSEQVILLKCTSTYPASPENINLLTIPHMRELFNCEVGLSDHTMGIGVAIGGVAHGATVVEKHFTMSRADGGVDAGFSMEPSEMKQLVVEVERVWQSLGSISYGPTSGEVRAVSKRRSIYIAEDMNKGELFTTKNLRVIRPGLGLSPKYYDLLLGRVATQNLDKGTAVSWEVVG